MTLSIIHRTTDLLAVARRHAAEPDEWPFAPRYDLTQRWYARLAAEEDHEVWLLTWLPGQSTDLHDHGGSAGAFVVVSGEVVEQTIASAGLAGLADAALPGHADTALAGHADTEFAGLADAELADAVLANIAYAEGEGHNFGAHHVHRIINASARPAVTVHAYGPALRTMTRYRLLDGDLSVESITRAGADW